ncbi:MAG: Crp/Fnr family transcriptional regulator [Desulfobacteraceae bacterium]|nr:Crp/Fnr family transcriptional regulator [Desulfobacteraceae bacterium]
MDQTQRIISESPLFSGLSEEQLFQVRDIAQVKKFGSSEIIFMDGDEGNGFYIVAEGTVKIYKVSAEGKEQILHIYGRGQPFGEVPVFAGQQFPACAVALKKTRLLFFPRAAFIGLITGNPSLALNMLAVLSMRLRQFTIQVENLSLKEVPARLASYLLYLAGEQNNPDLVTLPISKGQLASLLGTIAETLSRIFNRMTSQEIIVVNANQIRLNDKVKLKELSIGGKLQ